MSRLKKTVALQLVNKRGNYKKNYKWISIFILPSLVIFLMFYLIPIIEVVATSFTKWDGFNVPVFTGLDNYKRLFTSPLFIESLKNLLGWSLIAMTIHVGYGMLVAFILYKKPFGWSFTRTVFMIPNVISVAAWAMIYRYFFRDDIGILNTILRTFNSKLHIDWFYEAPYAFWAITFTWVFYAVVVSLIMLGDLMAIPDTLHEAAKIDGASSWQVIRKIDLPLCRNAIGTGIICSVTARIAMFESIYLTTNGAGNTMNIPVILVRALQDGNYSYANVNAVVMLVIGIFTLWAVNKVFKMGESIY
jgi:raffinose/stachyose/melibiose transport system permease protein